MYSCYARKMQLEYGGQLETAASMPCLDRKLVYTDCLGWRALRMVKLSIAKGSSDCLSGSTGQGIVYYCLTCHLRDFSELR